MQKDTTPVDITNLPELLKLAEEVRTSRTPRLLKRGQDQIALLSPVEPASEASQPRPRGKSANDNDWLRRLTDIGAEAARPDHTTDVSSNTDKYLAEAYADLHKPEK